MKKLISLLLCAALLSVLAVGALAETFTGKANGIGEVTVTLTVEDGKITAAEVVGDGETPGFGGVEACKDGTFAAQIVAAQGADIDGVSGATPLALIKEGSLDKLPSLTNLFVGNIGGCIGETSALALLIGFALLLYKDIIKWQVPVIYIAVVAALCTVFGRPVGPVYEILAGGLFLGAIFMATDYTTTPITLRGQMIFAVGCGLLTSLIRTWGGYPEGVSYSILIMNLTVPLIDRVTKPRIFGEVKKHG